MRISGYRLMWLLTMFDLPVTTKENRRDYRRFVDFLEDEGFVRVQYSVYVRPCATEENTDVHLTRITDMLPPSGEIRVLKFTDKQWGRMIVYRERRRSANEEAPGQFSFFDESLRPIVDEEPSVEVDHKLAVEAAEETPIDFLAALIKGAEGAKSRAARQRARKPKKEEPPSFDFFE